MPRPDPQQDHHIPLAARHPAERLPRLLHDPPDELDKFCPMCTPVWHGGWQHSPSCVARRAARP